MYRSSNLMHRTITEDSETWFLTLAPPLTGYNFESLNFPILAENLNYNVYDLLYNLTVVIKASVFIKVLELINPFRYIEYHNFYMHENAYMKSIR